MFTLPMAISRETRRALESGDLETIEDTWLGRMAEAPHDLDYYVGVLRAMVGVGEEEHALMLFELLDEELRKRGSLDERLELLRRADVLPLETGWIHDEAVSTLRRLHSDSEHFQPLLEKVGLHRAVEDGPKNWEKIDRLRELLQFGTGAIVRMDGKGVGRVVEVNLELDAFKVDFEQHQGLSVGFRAAGKLLEPLPEGHFLRRKLEEPDALARLAEEDPGALLGALLGSLERPLTAGDVRRHLASLIPDERWSSWWATARKHPQVVTRGKGRHTYSWAESSDHALDAVWRAFEEADRERRIEIFRRNAGRGEELESRMARALARLADEAVDERPAEALSLWFVLDRAGAVPGELEWSPRTVLAASHRPAQLLGDLDDRAMRDEAYALVRAERDDWQEVFLQRLESEEDPRSLDVLADALADAAPERLDRALGLILGRPRQSPATFVWLAERAGRDEELRSRRPLLLLQQIMASLAWPETRPHRQRLRALVESGATLPRLLPELAEDEARKAEKALLRAPLEKYEREPLVTALHLRFPDLRQEQEQPLYALEESLTARRAELKELLEVEIPANRKAIEEARELGDLRENFEYKSARQRHEYLSARATALDRDIGRARPLDLESVDPSQVRIGCRVRLEADGEERTVTILGPWESDPDAGVVSYESELGQRLLGLRPGAEVELEGRSYEVGEVGVYPG